ncbi:NADP-dependent 3-hydroxy acid dehydrogenase YdfG (YdfG) [Fructobacillus fructosus]|nr:NADP-dependent 3-hydroxy acid dehydrogenase YdfG (YdfG) [Fructobacillus fructosus]
MSFFNLPSHMTDSKIRENAEKNYEEYAILAERIASVVTNVLDMPADAAVNDITIRPINQVQQSAQNLINTQKRRSN